MSKNVKQNIRKILNKSVQHLASDYKGSSLTDIFILVDKDSGELTVYDDENNCITKEVVEVWAGLADNAESFDDNDIYVRDLRAVVTEMDMDNEFDVLTIYTPFSINLADEDFVVQEELLLIEDDSLIRIDNEFMQKIDKEFDEFLDRLMNE